MAVVVTGLDHVQGSIPPGGEDEARRFYVKLLGLREVPKPPALKVRGGLWLVGDGVHLHLGVEAEFRPARKAHIALLVDDLESCRSELVAHGVSVAEDDARLAVGRFYAFDPFGNRVELVAAADRGFTLRTAW
ncbi:MAG TPA: VOC family protein [Candidatus Limnocylindrales bacterium]|nr:VOC family protein [Candidatus Limnocylindrales bacterium]